MNLDQETYNRPNGETQYQERIRNYQQSGKRIFYSIVTLVLSLINVWLVSRSHDGRLPLFKLAAIAFLIAFLYNLIYYIWLKKTYGW